MSDDKKPGFIANALSATAGGLVGSVGGTALFVNCINPVTQLIAPIYDLVNKGKTAEAIAHITDTHGLDADEASLVVEAIEDLEAKRSPSKEAARAFNSLHDNLYEKHLKGVSKFIAKNPRAAPIGGTVAGALTAIGAVSMLSAGNKKTNSFAERENIRRAATTLQPSQIKS